MLRKTIVALAVAAAMAGGTTLSTTTPAEAGVVLIKKKRHGLHFRVRPGFYFGLGYPYRYRTYGFRRNRCASLRHKALVTGSAYWYDRWQLCRYRRLHY